MEKIEPKDMTKKVSVFKDNAFRSGYPYKITIYDEDVRKSILNEIKFSSYIYEINKFEEILPKLDTSLENGVNVIFKELISNNSIAVFVFVTPYQNYDIRIRIDHVEAQRMADDIRMDDILKIEEFEED